MAITFADRLKQLREAKGLSQADLAFKAGLHPQSVAKLEQGSREPAFFTVKAIAKVLGVSVAAFEDTFPSGDDARTASTDAQPKRAPGRPRKAAAGLEVTAEEPAEEKPGGKGKRKGGA